MKRCSLLISFCREEDGQDLIEYSLLVAILALSAVCIMSGTSVQTKDVWSAINASLTKANSAAS